MTPVFLKQGVLLLAALYIPLFLSLFPVLPYFFSVLLHSHCFRSCFPEVVMLTNFTLPFDTSSLSTFLYPKNLCVSDLQEQLSCVLRVI